MGGSLTDTNFTFQSDKPAGLTLQDLIDFDATWQSTIVARLNALQTNLITNQSINYQARGTTTPALSIPVGGQGTRVTVGAQKMPVEFAYWYRFGVGATFESTTGVQDTLHPIKRGGMFIPGVSDEYVDDGIFAVPVADDPDWASWTATFTVPLVVGSIQYDGGVLGEEIVPGTGWRIAKIITGVPANLTRLRSRIPR